MRSLRLILPAALALPLAGCELIGDVFELGVWAGAIIVILVVALAAFVVARVRG